MEGGLVEFGQPLGITQITPAQFQVVLTAFSNGDNAFNAGRSMRQAASDAYQGALSDIYDWLSATKNVLAGRFGVRWSTAWAQAGFNNNSTAIPAKNDDRIALTGRLAAFFTANPTYEVPGMQVTAAQANTLKSAVLTKQAALTSATRTLTGLGQTWDAAFQALTDEAWSLVKILQAILADNDPRWLAFGLQMPITPSTPGKPVNVTAQLSDSGAILVQCDAVATATRYRCRALIVDVETEYRLVASSTEPILAIYGILPGQTLQIVVQAVNGNLQGVASGPIVFTVPVTKAAKVAESTRAEVTSNGANGNGAHANGNGAHTNGNGSAKVHAVRTRL